MGPHNVKTAQFPKDSYVLSFSFEFLEKQFRHKGVGKESGFFELYMPPLCN